MSITEWLIGILAQTGSSPDQPVNPQTCSCLPQTVLGLRFIRTPSNEDALSMASLLAGAPQPAVNR